MAERNHQSAAGAPRAQQRGTAEPTSQDGWFFADDPEVQSTERLPDAADVEALAAQRLGVRPERPAQPSVPPGVRTAASRALFQAPPRPGDDTTTAALPLPADAREHAPAAALSADELSAEEYERLTYARSGTTPSEPPGGRRRELPQRFHDLNIFDALRDITALVCLVSAMATTFTAAGVGWLDLTGTIAGAVAVVGILTAQGLRWGLKTPRTAMTRIVRVASQIPALLAALLVVGADLVTSLPLLFASLPDGPPVGVGVGVSLMLVGALVGVEPRAHCGYLPEQRARTYARRGLIAIAIAAAASLLLALVMLIGRVFTTGWAYSLTTFADAIVSAVLLVLLVGSSLARDRSWFVTSVAAVAGLVIAAIADNTLALEFAAPISFATGFVYLPFLFAAFGVVASRSFVRTMPVSFQRVDWLVYATRAFELSVLLHTVGILWNVLTAIAGFGGVGRAPVVHLVQAVVCAIFVALSAYARRSLLERRAEAARASAVVASLALVVIGFLMIIVGSLATASGAGLGNGGVALAIGLAAGLMLTVPAPVRDEFGAPDLSRMFEDFRQRDSARSSLLSRVPDISAERARRKAFPSDEQ